MVNLDVYSIYCIRNEIKYKLFLFYRDVVEIRLCYNDRVI